MSMMIRRPRRTAGILLALVVAMGAVMGSGAFFSFQSSNPAEIQAGTLKHRNTQVGDDLVLSNASPGGAETALITLANTGSLPGTFTHSSAIIVDTPGSDTEACSGVAGGNSPCAPLSEVAQARIVDDGAGTVVYDGLLTGASVPPASLNPGEAKRYRVTVSFPESGADQNRYQGATLRTRATWTQSQ
jgi:hypothetical protein